MTITPEKLKEETDKVLNTLPPLQKRIVEMHYFEKKSLEEISQELGATVTEEEIRNIHVAALRSLRQVRD